MSFVKWSKLWFALGGLFIAASLAVLLFNWRTTGQVFNLGIDFTGGTVWIVRFEQPVALAELRAKLSGERVDITTIQAQNSAREDFRLKTIEMSEARREQFAGILQENFGNYELLSFENIGASAGSDLSRQALVLIILVLSGMLIYITFRFEFWTGLAAVLCLLHDMLVTLGAVSFLRLDFNLSMIAAVLTIVGYSINATIIIFDRVRENLRSERQPVPQPDFAAVADASLRSVLGRCIMTSFTTILAVLAVYLFGGVSIKNFALTMLIGFAAGTYSSIFLAAPLYALFRKAA
ncbi:preprotein translocase subunit SecF [Candidatus Termititenax aidoneus]|uniref:Protein-export membrane protein SecF n=1 Tax=Termititenax aidoneus TaxID=2218524 RepID=A0A388T8A1_TERA1|nr:preprotein translocase subunit SecF [Candidatus Termititenax aidoneus]